MYEEDKKQPEGAHLHNSNSDLQEFGYIYNDMAGSMSRTIDRVMNKFAKVCLRVDPLETKVKDQGNCESSRCQAEDLPPALPSLNAESKIM